MAAPHRISECGCTKTLSLVGMVDGILTKLRNQINHDSWLIDRLSTSINHPLFQITVRPSSRMPCSTVAWSCSCGNCSTTLTAPPVRAPKGPTQPPSASVQGGYLNRYSRQKGRPRSHNPMVLHQGVLEVSPAPMSWRKECTSSLTTGQ